MNIKIIGAGSIGNHLAQAARRMGWTVTVVDRDPEALARMKGDIYPSRYGSWDPQIRLATMAEAPRGGFDIICVGTPPDVRMEVARAALTERPRLLQLEKPLCPPTLEGLEAFLSDTQAHAEVAAVVGYDHAVGASVTELVRLLEAGVVGVTQSLDVEFREHWGGILAAHPWLSGVEESYLGDWRRGGGAGGEHSHALHLWRFLALRAGLGEWKSLSAAMEMRRAGRAEYDAIAAFTLISEGGRIGRVIQDVVTTPPRKMARVHGEEGTLEWICGGHPRGDLVRILPRRGDPVDHLFERTRPDDFHREMLHFDDLLSGRVKPEDSPISLASGVAVMALLAAAYTGGHAPAVIAGIPVQASGIPR
jgi:predicted dehydrogenase